MCWHDWIWNYGTTRISLFHQIHCIFFPKSIKNISGFFHISCSNLFSWLKIPVVLNKPSLIRQFSKWPYKFFLLSHLGINIWQSILAWTLTEINDIFGPYDTMTVTISGGCLDIKVSSYQYSDRTVKDKKVLRPSYLWHGYPIPGKDSLYTETGPRGCFNVI